MIGFISTLLGHKQQMIKNIDAVDWESEVVKQENPVVVDFWHDQCSWCLKLSPVLEGLAEEYPKAVFVKMNIYTSDENAHIANDFGVMGTPTLKVFCHGREIGEFVGFMQKEPLAKELESLLNRSTTCIKQSSVFTRFSDYLKKLQKGA